MPQHQGWLRYSLVHVLPAGKGRTQSILVPGSCVRATEADAVLPRWEHPVRRTALSTDEARTVTAPAASSDRDVLSAREAETRRRDTEPQRCLTWPARKLTTGVSFPAGSRALRLLAAAVHAPGDVTVAMIR